MKKVLFFSFVLLIIASAGLRAEHAGVYMLPPHIVVSGMGKASAAPDEAQIEIGVVTQAADAQKASQDNAARLDAVVKSIRSALPQDAEVQTTQVSVQPDYQYEEGKPPKISGYTVTNIVRVETSDLKAVSQVIDGAMKAGANNVQSLQFRMKDESPLRAEALRKAVADARAQAEVIAQALNQKVVKVLSLQAEGARPPIIYARAEMAMAKQDAGGPPTPVEPGAIDLHANVTLTVEIGQ